LVRDIFGQDFYSISILKICQIERAFMEKSIAFFHRHRGGKKEEGLMSVGQPL
jgi:hypothetical protein